MNRVGVGLAIGALLGAAIAWGVATGWRSGPDVTAHGAEVRASEIEALREAVARDRRTRERFEAELADIARRLAALESDPVADAAGQGARADAGTPADRAAEPGADPAEDQPPRADDAKPESEWFSADKLARLGFSPSEIDAIRARWEESVMSGLYLGDARMRGEAKPGKQMQIARGAINLELQADLGDEAYDALLYATNQKNRVMIKDVLEDSPAAEAGIQTGDEILSYDGNRIFNPFTFKQSTSKGELGEWVAIEVRGRDGTRRLFVRRGPLGVRLDFKVVKP